MAITMEEQTTILNLVVSMFDAAPGAANMASITAYYEANNNLSDLATALSGSAAFTAQFAGMDNSAIADEMISHFGLTRGTTMLAGEAEKAHTYFVTELANGTTKAEMLKNAALYLSSADGIANYPIASSTLANKTTVAEYYSVTKALSGNTMAELTAVIASVDATAGSVTNAEQSIDTAGIITGKTISLTSGNDNADNAAGTTANDTFLAYLSQNQFAGGVSNTLSSADVLDGGSGDDSLFAQIVPEFFGVTGNNQIDIQARTTSIETVAFEARDAGSNDTVNTVVSVDAKNMTDVVKIGSQFSDGDLVIENLTTLTKAGAARNTDAITITMDHTDNYNSDIDASDLTVYFDEDYLLTGQSTGGASLIIDMSNALSIKTGGSPVEGFTSVSFSVGTTDVLVDVTGAASYTEVVTRINAKLTELGLTTVKAETMAQKDVRFSIDLVVGTDDVITYSNGELAGQYSPIIVTNTGAETLMQGSFDKSDVTMDATIANSQRSTAATTTVNPLAVNIELEKVGRDGEGGNLVVGGKELDRDGGATTKGNGIDQFDILVTGTSAQPSNLGYITSTNNALQTVNISSAAGSTASLTVRDAFASNENANTATGANVETVNANSFVNDLNIGEDTAMMNVDTFTATGNGKITLYSNIDGTEQGGTWTVTTGSNDDSITQALNGDAVDTIGETYTITTGAGNDTVSLTMGAGVSQGTMAILKNLSVNTDAGMDTITVNSYGNYNIKSGADSDFVHINSATDTTGTTTVGTVTGVQTWGERVLYDAKLTLNFAGLEQTVNVVTTAANNFKATQLEINTAIKLAISSNPELAKLLIATDLTGKQAMTISSLVGGDNDLSIDIFQPQLIATGVAAANQTLVQGIDVSALRVGLLATETVPGLSADLEDAAEIVTFTNGLADFYGSVAQNGAANKDASYNLSTNTDGGSAELTTAALNANGAYTYLLDANLGTDTVTDVNFSTINLGDGANDLLVLHSNDLSMNTIVIDGSFGKDTIVNFFDIAPTMVSSTKANVGLHQIDFTSLLSNKVDISVASGTNVNNADSARAIAVTLHDAANVLSVGATAAADSIASANSVNVLHYDESIATSVKFDDFTASQLLTKLNDQAVTDTTVLGGLTEASLSIAAFGTTLVGTTQNHIVMVENMDNLGEYKVFKATSTLDSTNKTLLANANVDDFTSVDLLGTLDFGHSINFNLVGDATSSTILSGLISSTDAGATIDPGTGTVTPTPVDPVVPPAGTTPVAVTAAGTSAASDALTELFTMTSGTTYTHTITNFDTVNDNLRFDTTAITAASISIDNTADDGMATLSYSPDLGVTTVTVVLTGLTSAEDLALTGVAGVANILA